MYTLRHLTSGTSSAAWNRAITCKVAARSHGPRIRKAPRHSADRYAPLFAPRRRLWRFPLSFLGPQEDSEKYWLLNYLKVQSDYSYLATPFAFPPQSPILQKWIDGMERELVKPGHEYNLNFAQLVGLVRDSGLEGAIVPAETCSPVSPRYASGCIKASRRSTFQMEKIWAALCVNNFWQSSKVLHGTTSATTPHELGSKKRVEAGSCWDEILKRAEQFAQGGRHRTRLKGKQLAPVCRAAQDRAPPRLR